MRKRRSRRTLAVCALGTLTLGALAATGPSPHPDPRPEAVTFWGRSGLPPRDTDQPFLLDCDVAAIVGESDRIGDIDVTMHLLDPWENTTRVSLVSPEGTRVQLTDGTTPGRELAGSFATQIHPAEPLSAFVGETYAGTWWLEVEDYHRYSDVLSWRVFIRPEWSDRLHAPPSLLFVRRLIHDAENGTLELRADLESGKTIVNTAGSTIWLTLYDADDGRVLLEQDLSTWHWDTYERIERENVRTRLRVNHRRTSRQRLRLRMTDLDLPQLPDRVRVRLRTGIAIGSQSVPLENGRYDARSARPLGDGMWIDRATCYRLGEQCSAVVKGRLVGNALPEEFGDHVDLVVGDTEVRCERDQFVERGAVRSMRGKGPVRRVRIDLETGRFKLVVRHTHQRPFFDDEDSIDVVIQTGEHLARARTRPRKKRVPRASSR